MPPPPGTQGGGSPTLCPLWSPAPGFASRICDQQLRKTQEARVGSGHQALPRPKPGGERGRRERGRRERGRPCSALRPAGLGAAAPTGSTETPGGLLTRLCNSVVPAPTRCRLSQASRSRVSTTVRGFWFVRRRRAHPRHAAHGRHTETSRSSTGTRRKSGAALSAGYSALLTDRLHAGKALAKLPPEHADCICLEA